MKRLSIPLRMMFTLMMIAMLAACAPGEATISPEEVAAQVATSVAQTMEAQGQIATAVALTVSAKETEAAEALPTATQAAIPLPTMTLGLVTATPLTLVTPATESSGSGSGSSGGGGGGGGGSGTTDYSCDPDLGKRPFDNSEYRPGDSFDIKFTIMNTGTETWPAGYDLVYYSGPFMAPAFPAVIELPKMEPGDKFAVGPYDAIAPDDEGFQVMTFKLQGGFCWPYIAIIVK